MLVFAIGIATLVYLAGQIAFWLYATFLRKDDLKRFWKDGCWAVVTGGSDGIGLGFAKRLAARGFNVLITGRNEEKLRRVREGLEGTGLWLF
jgi:hypothetical protein